MQKKVYILLVNYNGHDDTVECLESILKSSHSHFQVFVIDNSPGNNSMQLLENWAKGQFTVTATSFEQYVFPPVQKPVDYISLQENQFYGQSINQKIAFVKANHNNGFAAANNVGLKYIRQFGNPDDIIWILNNDTVVEPHTLQEIVLHLSKDTNSTTLYGTPLLEYYNPKKIQSIGGSYNSKTGLPRQLSAAVSKAGITAQYLSTQKIDYPEGASIIIKQPFLQTVGLMEEGYFIYFEELDWSYRAKKQNGAVVILPITGVYHKQGKALVNKNDKKPEFIDLAFIRSKLMFAWKFNKKNYKKIVFFSLTLTLAKRLLKGNFKIIPKIIRLTTQNPEKLFLNTIPVQKNI